MKGFTVIELMIVLVIAGILVTLGVPAMTNMIKDNRISAETNRLATSIRFARSEAIKRNQVVSIAKVSGSDKEWEAGWEIYVDVSGDGNQAIDIEGGDILLRQESEAPTGLEVRSDDNGNRWLSYNSDGTLNEGGEAAEYFICDDRGAPEGAAVSISVTGRINVGAINGDSCTPP